MDFARCCAVNENLEERITKLKRDIQARHYETPSLFQPCRLNTSVSGFQHFRDRRSTGPTLAIAIVDQVRHGIA